MPTTKITQEQTLQVTSAFSDIDSTSTKRESKSCSKSNGLVVSNGYGPVHIYTTGVETNTSLPSNGASHSSSSANEFSTDSSQDDEGKHAFAANGLFASLPCRTSDAKDLNNFPTFEPKTSTEPPMDSSLSCLRSPDTRRRSPDLKVRFSNSSLSLPMRSSKNGALELPQNGTFLVQGYQDVTSSGTNFQNGIPVVQNNASSLNTQDEFTNSSSTLNSEENSSVWLDDDQLLLLPATPKEEKKERSSKSYDGLLSPNGTSILWDEDTDWILLFDNLLRYTNRKQRTIRSCGCRGSRGDDETDSKSQASVTKSASKRASSAPPTRRSIFTSSKSLPTANSAGGADEDMFMKSFEDVPRITLYSAKELESELNKIKDTLGEASNDWEKRIEMCKRLRSLLIAGGHEYEEFYSHLRSLEQPFQVTVKDLRSQVVREGCLSIAFLSQLLGPKLDHFAESLLPSLINLIPNSAKIMSTAGIVAIRFIIKFTHASRLIPILATHLSSKSKDIRKTCYEFLDQLLMMWPTPPMEKHIPVLTDAIRRGISDADPEARAFSRKAFWSFSEHFKDQADMLLSSLDSSKQRMLQDEQTLSNSSSSSSLTQAMRPPAYRSTHAGSVENLSLGRTGTLGRRSNISNLPTAKNDASSGIPTRQLRSTSAIDLSAVRRAKARASYSTLANLQRGSNASLPRTPAVRRTDSMNNTSINAITSPERVLKSRTRGSQSQPNSRPDSPSSRLSYATYSSTDGKSNRPRNKSGIPIATSRDASPTRTSFVHERRLSGSRSRLTGAGEKYPVVSSSAQPLMAERTLQQSREAEVAVADALRTPARRRYNAFDDQSDESETSSVCSDRSFSSYGRCVDDINEVIHNLHSIHWSDRKEGLHALQGYFRSGRVLSHIELKKVTDIFAKIFMDPHTKVFSLFLDALNELIAIHKNDLYSWLYVLMTRLFLKMGCDILGSVLAKIQKTLEIVKDSFPYENQFNSITRFLNDQTQTPNVKVKLSILKYLHSLISEMDPSKFSSTNSEVSFAFMKVISWTTQPKNSDLRKCGEDVLVALFSLNPSEYSNLIDQLPKAYKDSAFQLLHSRYPRSNSDSSSPRSGIGGKAGSPCPIMSHLQSPNSTSPWPRSHGGTPQSRSFEYDDTENLNPEEISDSWKKTMSEIAEYKSNSDFYDNKVSDKLISSRHSSLDGRSESLVDRLELNSSADSSPKRSPSDYTSLSFPRNEASLLFDGELAEHPTEMDNEIDDHKTIQSIVSELNQGSRNEKRIQALGRLIAIFREQSSVISNEDFCLCLRAVIQTVTDTSIPVKTLALKALHELIKTKADYFSNFIELTVLRILEAYKDTENDVIKVAELCSSVAAVHLPPDQCVRTLNALILTGQMPVNQAAIKMLTKLVEHHPQDVILSLLPEVMPALIKAYDNNESAVRKASVFCMVAIYCKVGEAMQPHLQSLNSCKMKLLNVYIKKAQLQATANGSTPSSPGNPPSSSSSQ